MGFTSLCYKNPRADVWVRLRRALRTVAALLWCGTFLLAFTVHAQGAPAVTHLGVNRTVEGLFLDVSMDFALPALVQEALEQGIAMTFVSDVQVTRGRWYWADAKVADVHRFMRLSYQPLTRRWRLSVSSTPFSKSGLGVSVGQTYDELPEVLAAMQRIARWNIADATDLDAEASYRVHFHFQLDMTQLPRPLQIGALSRSGWALSLSRTERVPPMGAP